MNNCAYDVKATVLDSDLLYLLAPTNDDGDISAEMQLELDTLDSAGYFDIVFWTKELLKQKCPLIFAELEKSGVVMEGKIIITNLDLKNPETSRF